MLKSVTLQNYKCFSKKTQIELAPLTILTGVNNSGKTTILKSIAALPDTHCITYNREQLLIPYLSRTVKKWLNRMELGNLKSAGARYVLPILTAGTQLKKGQTLIVENPEIFLHPKNQMELADFFISLVNKNRQVIIETHSDHIINRVLRRVLECETESLLNATTIYFLEQSSIKEIEMDRVQGISKCPEDFFRQFALETNQIFNAGINNIGKTEPSIKEIPINRCLGIREAPNDFFGQFADETGHIISAGLDNIKKGHK